MSKTTFALVAPAPDAGRLPDLDSSQLAVCEESTRGHVVFRGAPGSGKTTSLLAVVRDCVKQGQSFAFIVPDRARAERLGAKVRALAPGVARPVKTAVGFAYGVLDMWRTLRADPLGGLELLTGAQEDALVGDVLATVDLPHIAEFMGQGLPSDLVKMEMRNLLATADRCGVDVAELTGLAQRYDFLSWADAARVLFELNTDQHADKRGALRLRHSQVERMAAAVLERWDENAPAQQVTAECPVPQVVIVDDVQDMTAATVHLLKVAARCGARIVAASEPDAAVSTYRGAIPQADVLLAHALGVRIGELGTVYRGSPEIRGAIRRITDNITLSGPASRRRSHVAPLPADGDGFDAPTSGDSQQAIQVHAAHTDAQMGAHIARILRENYLFAGRSWADQVVIVRSQGVAAQMRRHLRRASVPLNTSTRAFEFMSEPTTRLLIELIVHAQMDGAGDPDRALRELVTSAFIGVDPVDLHRLQRTYGGVIARHTNSEHAEALPVDSLILRLYLDPIDRAAGQTLNAQALADCEAYPELAAYRSTLEKLTTAASVWEAARAAGPRRPLQALWSMWEATGVASAWQNHAISHAPDAYWYDGQLDVIVALFRVADVWEQRNPSHTAAEFAIDMRDHGLPIDTLLPAPNRPDAVCVLTPSEAAGGQWPVVILAGVQHERWPNVVLRNQMLHADTLADIKMREATGAEEPTWQDVTHVRGQRRRVKDDEYRMFVSALGSACHEVHLAVVSNEDQAPSELVDRALGVRVGNRVESVERDEDGTPRYRVKPAPSPLDASGVIGDLRYWACAPTGVDEAAAGPSGDEASDSRVEMARRALAMLMVEGIRGAHPKEWGTPGGLSSNAPVLGGQKPSISPSAVEKIETCPLSWFASKIGADSTPGYSAATRGTFVHSLAEEYHHDPSIPIRTLFEQRWPEYSEGLDGLELQREREKAEACVEGLESYFAHVPDWVEELTQVELFIRQDMGAYTIRGMIDRLEPDGNGVKIVDFKTGKAKKAEEALVDPQLQTYQVALIASGATVTGAQLQYVSEGEKKGRNVVPAHINGMRVQRPLTAAEYSDRITALERDIALMNSHHFQAILGPKCDYCALHAICPAQQSTEGELHA